MKVGTKRYFLMGMLATAGLGAVLAVGILIYERIGSYHASEAAIQVGLIVGLGLTLAFAAYTAFDRDWWGILAIIGVWLTGLSVALLVGLAVYETFIGSLPSAWEAHHIDEITWTFIYTSALLCLVPCIGALRMNSPGARLQVGTISAMVGLYVFQVAETWTEGFGIQPNPVLSLWVAILYFLTGTGFLSVFAAYSISRLKLPDPLSTLDQRIFLRCPSCLKEQDVPVGESHCMACRLRITVDIEEPKCPKCGYNLRSLTRPICPECGAAIVPEEVDPQAALLK